jgi:hypothetical protein
MVEPEPGLRERARAIREGFRVWTDAGQDPAHYREAEVRFSDGSVGSAWQYLDRV